MMAVSANTPVPANAGSVLSWSHTTSGSNRYLIAEIHFGDRTTTVVTASYSSVAMTFLGRQAHATQTFAVELWGLANPAIGSNTITITLSGANPGMANGSISFAGVDQANPTSGVAGTQANPATNATSAAETGSSGQDMLVADAAGDVSFTVAGGGTEGWNTGTGDADQYKIADGTSQTCSWTNASGNWVTLVVLLKAAVTATFVINPTFPRIRFNG